MKKRLLETACPRFTSFSAEAVPPKVFSLQKGWSSLGDEDNWKKSISVKKHLSEDRLSLFHFVLCGGGFSKSFFTSKKDGAVLEMRINWKKSIRVKKRLSETACP